MKQKIWFLVVFLSLNFCVGSFALGGPPPNEVKILEGMHPFYDAQILADAFENETIKNEKILIVLKLLSKYVKNEELKTLHEKLITEFSKGYPAQIVVVGDDYKKYKEYIFKEEGFKGNAFLEKYIGELIDKLKRIAGVDTAGKSTPSVQDVFTSQLKPKFAAIGILSPVMAVDALASFIANRFKEELYIAFLNKIKKNEALKKLFPKTSEFLTSAGVYNFKLFLPTLKAVIHKDLNAFDEGLFNYIDYKWEKVESNVKKNKILNLVLFLWEQLVKVKKGKHPISIIDDLNQSQYIEHIDSKFSSAVRLMALISRNLRNENGDGWLEEKELLDLIEKDNQNKDKLVIKDELFVKLFLGLIYARENKELDLINFSGSSLKATVDDSAKKISETAIYIFNSVKYINGISAKVKDIKNSIHNFKTALSEADKYKIYRDYLSTVIDLIKFGIDQSELFTKKKPEIENYSAYAEKILEISDLILGKNKKYDEALLKTLELLNKDLIPNESPLKAGIVKFFTFAINISRAESTQDVLSVIESAALPVGSYRLNRTRNWTFTLNSYAGIFANNEYPKGNNDLSKSFFSTNNIAFTAPVGLALSKGIKYKGTFTSSLSIFASIIDVGAIVRYRLRNEEGGLSELTWKDVLAPGFFLMYGFPKFPLCLGIGAQLGPKLTKVFENGELEIKPSRIRLGFMLVLDMPIFKF